MNRWIRAVLFWGSLVVATPVCHGEPEVFFTSQQSVEEKMVRLIERADVSIDMALFELRSPRLAGVLARAKERGVRVRLILDAEHAKQGLAAGEVRLLGGKNMGGRGIMHHKFALFDKKQVVTGSFNWTPGAEHANYENALLLDDPNMVGAYSREFETLWRRALEGPPPTGPAPGTNAPKRRSKSRHSTANRLKTIRIRVTRPVIKCRRKAQTYRP
jgi:phosphatidylserine/phosphatidylglycerophosphate/cardiolipin synthase-like enzyme